jgi:hypothetical protein
MYVRLFLYITTLMASHTVHDYDSQATGVLQVMYPSACSFIVCCYMSLFETLVLFAGRTFSNIIIIKYIVF